MEYIATIGFSKPFVSDSKSNLEEALEKYGYT